MRREAGDPVARRVMNLEEEYFVGRHQTRSSFLDRAGFVIICPPIKQRRR
jgi:hypothetical protein